jgi:hypothetical protein
LVCLGPREVVRALSTSVLNVGDHSPTVDISLRVTVIAEIDETGRLVEVVDDEKTLP